MSYHPYPTVKLNTGAVMPAIGLGTWSGTTKEEQESALPWYKTALKVRPIISYPLQTIDLAQTSLIRSDIVCLTQLTDTAPNPSSEKLSANLESHEKKCGSPRSCLCSITIASPILSTSLSNVSDSIPSISCVSLLFSYSVYRSDDADDAESISFIGLKHILITPMTNQIKRPRTAVTSHLNILT